MQRICGNEIVRRGVWIGSIHSDPITWIALNVYRMCGSCPSHGENPPVTAHWHFLMNSRISSRFSLDRCPSRSKAVTPQYTPDIRRNSVMQYSWNRKEFWFFYSGGDWIRSDRPTKSFLSLPWLAMYSMCLSCNSDRSLGDMSTSLTTKACGRDDVELWIIFCEEGWSNGQLVNPSNFV